MCVCVYYKIGNIKAPGPAVNIYARLYPSVLSDATTNSISPPLYWTLSLHDGLKGGGGERNASGCQDQKKERTFIYISYGEEDEDDFLPFYNLDDMEPIYLFKKSKSTENLFSLLVQQRSAANGPSPKVDLATSTSL